MKKSIKILILVLSLALICSALVVAAFADTTEEITGIRLDNSGDFENMTVTEIASGSSAVYTDLDTDNNAANPVTFKYQGNGEGKIVTNPVDNNTYITVDFAGTTSGNSHYIQTYTQPNGWGTYTADSNEYYNEIKYYVADFDVAWFDVANYNGAGSFYPYAVYSDVAGSSRVAVDSNFGISFSKSNGKVVAKFKGGDGTGYELGNEKWSHVTWIMEPIIITDDAGQNIKIKQYLAIDGTVVGVHEWTSTTAASAVYNGDRTRIYSLDMRFNPFGSAGAAGCADNYNFRTFLPEYNGNLATVLAGGIGADLTTFESNLYDADAMPYGKTVATNGETPYDSLQKAIDAAAEGDTITLCSNVTGTVTVGKDITINYGDYTMAAPVTANKLVAVNDETNKAYTFEPADIEYVKSGVTYYALLSDSASFSNVISNATAETTIKFLQDVELDLNATISVGKILTFDLGSNTVIFNQTTDSEFRFDVSKDLTVQNGTMYSVCTGPNTYGKTGQTYPLFFISSGADLTLTDLTTYTGSMVYSYSSQGSVVTVNGGTHYAIFGSRGTDSSWFNTRSNVDLVVNNATMFTDTSVCIASFKETYSKSTKTTDAYGKPIAVLTPYSATFNNSTLISYSDGNKAGDLFKYAHSDLTLTFNNCSIYGNLSFSADTTTNKVADANDTAYHVKASPITSENIIFEGTNYFDTAHVSVGYSLASGTISTVVGTNKKATVALKDVADLPTLVDDTYVYDYTTTDKSLTLTYDAVTVIGEIDEYLLTENTEAGCNFTITTSDGKVYYTDELAMALTLAPAGSTVTLNKDLEEMFPGSLGVISGKLTIDLGGHTLTISQSDLDAYITVATNDTVTIKNGTIIASCDNNVFSTLGESITRGLDRAIPVFVAYEGANGVTGLAVDIVVDNVNTYTGAIFHNESATGSKFTVNGGVHQAVALGTKFTINGTSVGEMSNGGIVQSRTNTVATFNDAKIWMNYCSSAFATSHKNQTNSAIANKTEIIYNDSVVVLNNTDNKPLIIMSDADTYVYFNDTDVYGPLIVPKVETGTAMGADNVIFGMNSSYGYSASGATSTLITPTVADGLTTFTFTTSPKITVSDANVMLANVNGQFHRKDLPSESIPAGFLSTDAINKSYNATYIYSTPAYEIVVGGVTVQRPSTDNYAFKQVLAEADDGSTITLLADVKVGTTKITINKNITIDLNGHVLDAFLPYHYASDQYYTSSNNLTNSKITTFGLSEGKTVTFKGEKEGSAIIFGCYTNSGTTPVSGTLIGPGKNSTVNFEGANLNVSGPCLAATWIVTGWTVNIDGGYYNKNNSADNSAWIYANASSTGVTVNIKNAVFNATVGGATGAGMECSIENSTILLGIYTYGAPDVKYTVTGSYLSGINTTKTSNGVTSTVEPTAVVIREGCYFTNDSWFNCSTTTFAEGIGVVSESNTVNHKNYTQKFAVITDENGIIVSDPTITTFTETTVARSYTYKTATADGYNFSYTSDGLTYYSSKGFADVVSDAPAGSTITFLTDAVVAPTGNIGISKDLTIDLNKKTFELVQPAKFSGMLNISTLGVDFVLKNGTVKWYGAEGYGKTSALIRMTSGNATVAASTVTLENLVAYGPVAVYNENHIGSTITVTGGEYYLTGTYEGTAGAFIETRVNTTVNVSGAKLYVNNQGLLSSMHYKQVTTQGLAPNAEGGYDGLETTYTFANCEISGESVSKNVVYQSNEYTTVEFNACKIIGSVNPGINGFESSASALGKYTDADGNEVARPAIGTATDGSITFGIGTTYMSGATLNCVKFLATRVPTANSSISIEFSDDAYGTKTSEGTVIVVSGEISADTLFAVIVNGESVGQYDDLASAVAAAPAGATIQLLGDVTITAVEKIVTIDKALTIDLGGYHLQVIQAGAAAQIFIDTTATVTITNGRISCAADATYRKTLTTTNSSYDVGSPLFVANSVAVDLVLNGVSTYTAGIFYNEVSGSKITVIGGYHQQNSITYPQDPYLERALVISKASITSVFEGASIWMDWCGGLFISTAQNENDPASFNSTFTYNGCVVNFTGAHNQIIRYVNGKTYAYFNDCDVYGAFVKPANMDDSAKYGSFTSANLIFDKDCTWGYPTTEEVLAKTLITPTFPEGYVLSYASAKVSYQMYAITGQIHAGTLDFASVATNGTITVTYKLVKLADQLFTITSDDNVTYYDSVDDFANIVKNATLVTLLNDIEVTPTASITINNNITFELGGHRLTLVQTQKNTAFTTGASNKTIIFQNGSVATVPGAASGTYSTSTFCFLYVSRDSNVEFNDVSGSVGTLVFVYNGHANVKVTGGTYTLNTNISDITPGFISSRSNVEVEVTGTTIYVDKGYLMSSESYNEALSQISDKTSIDLDAIGKSYESNYTFTNCKIIGQQVTTDVMYRLNAFTTVTFDGCYIYGSMTPNYDGTDSTGLTYLFNKATGKYVTWPSACECGAFADANNDGKCDVETCKKYNPAYDIERIYIAASTPANIVLQGGTLYTSASDLATNASRPDYVIEHTVTETVEIDGLLYTFDRMADYAYVIWYDEKGNELDKQMIAENFTLEAYEYAAAGGTTNDWYKIGGYVANSWTDKLGGTVAVDLSKVDLANLTGNLEYYPQAADISAYLSAAMYNLSITGVIRNNLYIPETPENVEILGVFVGDREVTGTKVLFRDYNNAPVYYTLYVINEVGATEFTKATTVTVKYTVDGTELTQLYSLSAESYANIIYNDKANGTGAYGEVAYNVVADLVRYSYNLSVYLKTTDDYADLDNSALEALYNKMSDMCSDLPVNITSSTNVTNLVGYVKSATYDATTFEPRWLITMVDGAKVTDVKITLEGWNSGVYADRTNFGTQTYNVEQITRDADGYIKTAYSQNIPIYNIAQTMTITVVVDGEEISGTYDLGSYYAGVVDKISDDLANFIKSAYALADSTIAYKFPEGKIDGSDVADFWECDHEGVGEVQERVSVNYVFKPRFCEKCDSWLFYYEDYGAVANGQTNHTRDFHITGTNDYEAIFWTHANANEWAQRSNLNLGKHTAVVGNSTPETDKNYYISLPEGTGVYVSDIDRDGTPETTYVGENLGTIVIATDTSWNGVNLLIDDDVICNNYAANYDSSDPNPPTSDCECGRKHAYVTQPIFTVDEYDAEDVIMDLKGKVTSLAAGATSIGYAPGRKMLIELRDYDKNIYFRYGSNANNGAAITEVILVDEFGNIDPSTPVQWDYVNLNDNKNDLVKAYAVDTDPIKISGLDANGQINAIFETYVNNSLDQYLYHYEACYRNITIKRSNATVEGIDRNFLEEPADNANNTNDRMAYTFINVQYCSNATVKDMLVINHNSQAGDSGTGQGSYEFSGGTANAVSWINCETKNMFSNEEDGSLQAYPIYRGLFGTNHIRNMYLEDCYLNSFDAHTGAYNVTIVNSTFDHMNFIGGGLIKLTDVTIYTSKSYGCAINLRTDYGSTWNGDIEIDGLTIKYGSDSSYKPTRISLLYGAYANQYWGFDTYTPQNVTINNFHVQQYTAEIVDGVRVESNIIEDASTMPVYYYYGASYKDGNNETIAAGHMHTLTGVPAKSEAGEHGPEDKGDPNITYDYGTNHLEATKNLTISNSVSIILPTGDFWSEMNVTVNGDVYNYVPGSKATNGTWEEE